MNKNQEINRDREIYDEKLYSMDVIIHGVPPVTEHIIDIVARLLPQKHSRLYLTPRICTCIQLSPNFEVIDHNVSYGLIGRFSNPIDAHTTDIYRIESVDGPLVERIVSEEGKTLTRVIFNTNYIINCDEQLRLSHLRHNVVL